MIKFGIQGIKNLYIVKKIKNGFCLIRYKKYPKCWDLVGQLKWAADNLICLEKIKLELYSLTPNSNVAILTKSDKDLR
jgi:hypothetical protein